ncbi:sulfur carrier protein ThiS [Desulforhopalus vacuolatus]|uniref:sulfur carrier protein ThiS n=1 Tax=Desulforhopalus vacuolatus TaxID=40414 RepID=UPI001962A5AA|nr:sulfur carrier protein ThiS [Desulforhopalus vacuolatus]MBM9520543.1 sulfur carrier protein ThiS [Desulforhopalus vacuolatus]
MQIHINGKAEESVAETIAELISERKLATKSLVVEHNRTIVKQARWAEVQLHDGDKIELLSFVGGG